MIVLENCWVATVNADSKRDAPALIIVIFTCGGSSAFSGMILCNILKVELVTQRNLGSNWLSRAW